MKLTKFIITTAVVIAATVNFGTQGFPRPQLNIKNKSEDFVMVDGFAFDGPINGLIISPNDSGSLRTTSAVPRPFPTLPPTRPPIVVPDLTTVRPDIAGCARDCKVTSEYNPVCGSNGVMYNNAGLLICARNCGINVSQVRTGRCTK